MGMNRMADALSATASAYAKDDDPEFVRVGAPSTLKMVEMMVDRQPSHAGLLLTACSGFAQYAYGFLHLDSEIAAVTNAQAARDLAGRAARMYARSRGYCLRELAMRHPQLPQLLASDPVKGLAALDGTARADVPALFWAGAAWAGELAAEDNQLVRLAELAIARAFLARALALDETWGGGAIHEAMIAVEGLPALVGGSRARARQHFERAVALAEGQSAQAYVTMAASVAMPGKDRGEFTRLLEQALAVDPSRRPELRLANLLAQKRARFLLGNADRLFR